MMEPILPVNWSHPKAIPRLLSSVESATSDWIAGVTIASPMPFRALDIATCLGPKPVLVLLLALIFFTEKTNLTRQIYAHYTDNYHVVASY